MWQVDPFGGETAAGPTRHRALFHLSHFKNSKVLPSAALCDPFVSLLFPHHIWELLGSNSRQRSVDVHAQTCTVWWQQPCTMTQSCRSIQSLSFNDLIFLPSKCVCGRRVGAGRRETAQERRDGSQMEGGDSRASGGSERCFYHRSETHTRTQSRAKALLTVSEI